MVFPFFIPIPIPLNMCSQRRWRGYQEQPVVSSVKTSWLLFWLTEYYAVINKTNNKTTSSVFAGDAGKSPKWLPSCGPNSSSVTGRGRPCSCYASSATDDSSVTAFCCRPSAGKLNILWLNYLNVSLVQKVWVYKCIGAQYMELVWQDSFDFLLYTVILWIFFILFVFAVCSCAISVTPIQ